MLASLTQQFEAGEVAEARLSAEHLVGAVVGLEGRVTEEHGHLLHLPLSSEQEARLGAMALCRLAAMPVQYLVGRWHFHMISLDLRPPVFIPRQETEQLVEEVLARLPAHSPRLLEVGPGSGAVSLALLAARPDLTVTAVERSSAAVELTRHNAERLGLQDRLTVIHCRVEQVQLEGGFDAVVSNPPYVLRKDLAALAPEIHVYEDLRALDGGKEGLDVILPIVELAGEVLEEGGFLALEVDPCHPLLLPPRVEGWGAEVIKDIHERDRFMVLRPK